MKNFLASFCLCLSFFLSPGQTPYYSLFLIGDTGEDTTAGPALKLLQKNILACGKKSGLVFLGDNIYPNGFNPKTERKLFCQLALIKDYKGMWCFIPGNHDWDAQRKGGLKAVCSQHRSIAEWTAKNAPASREIGIPFMPQPGFPGPSCYSPNDKLLFVFIDTQWFLHYGKVMTTGTRKQTGERFFHELDSVITMGKQQNKQVVLMGHHPIYTNGLHSRGRQPIRFLVNYTPFQLLGLAGLNRLLSQDLPQPRYGKMRERLLAIIEKHGNVVYASGHEHNLQFFERGNNRFIVSGAGSKTTRLRKRQKHPSTFGSDDRTGFMKMEFYEGGKTKLFVFRTGMDPVLVKEW